MSEIKFVDPSVQLPWSCDEDDEEEDRIIREAIVKRDVLAEELKVTTDQTKQEEIRIALRDLNEGIRALCQLRDFSRC